MCIFPQISFQVLRIPRRNYAYAWGFGDPFQKRLATKFQQELSFPIGTFFLFPEKEMGLPTPVASWTGPCTRSGPAGGIPDQPGSQTAKLICQHFRKIPKSANLCPGFWCSKMWIQGDISGETPSFLCKYGRNVRSVHLRHFKDHDYLSIYVSYPRLMMYIRKFETPFKRFCQDHMTT